MSAKTSLTACILRMTNLEMSIVLRWSVNRHHVIKPRTLRLSLTLSSSTLSPISSTCFLNLRLILSEGPRAPFRWWLPDADAMIGGDLWYKVKTASKQIPSDFPGTYAAHVKRG